MVRQPACVIKVRSERSVIVVDKKHIGHRRLSQQPAFELIEEPNEARRVVHKALDLIRLSNPAFDLPLKRHL